MSDIIPIHSGIKEMTRIEKILEDMTSEYRSDNRPWVIGYSGGKDSTMVVQLTYEMLSRLSPKEQNKRIHILSTNTMVESPAIIQRLKNTCLLLEKEALSNGYPVEIKLLRPEITDTFWVNVIGRGYPAPNKWFRWCTDRLKIKPMNKHILDNIKRNGEVLILLGTRKSESKTRAESMEKHEIENFYLRKHGSIKGAFVYSPIEDLTEDEVWTYLLDKNSKWKSSNEELYRLYKGEETEINFMMDDRSASSGHSRFGCWTCTVVDKDKALQSLIDEGHKEYLPLLKFRNKLKTMRDDPDCREKYRRNQRLDKFYDQYYGKVQDLDSSGHMILGPFTLKTRHDLYDELLSIQNELKKTDSSAELITSEEIMAIKMAWIYDGDDPGLVQKIYEGEIDISDPEEKLIDCLLLVERDLSDVSRRVGIYGKLESVISEYSMNKIVSEKNDN